MNLTRERWGGKRASTRTGRREATLEQLSARVQTLELATRHACAEAKRRERPLVYEVRGHNLSGPLRVPTRQGSRLAGAADVPSRPGVFLTVTSGAVRRTVNTRA